MNFLSHYYFDKSSSNPERILGGILPDLIHQHNKTWVFNPEKKKGDYSGKTLDLWEGWKKHKAIDKYFHSSPYFKSKTDYIKNKIYAAFLNSPVWSFFLAHITLELSLDSLLINENQVEVEEFYGKLKKVEPEPILEFLKLNQVSIGESFLPFLKEFIDSAYLEKYRNPADLTYPLSRICYRIWKVKFNNTEIECLRETILDFCDENRNKFLEIYLFIENQIKNEGN